MVTANRKDRRMPLKTKDVNLTGEWEGWNAKLRVNPPIGPWINKMEQLTSMEGGKITQQLTLMCEILADLLVSWNFVDEDGNDIPANLEGLLSLGMELLGELFNAANEVTTEAPLDSA